MFFSLIRGEKFSVRTRRFTKIYLLKEYIFNNKIKKNKIKIYFLKLCAEQHTATELRLAPVMKTRKPPSDKKLN